MNEEERKYYGDVEFEVWRSGGNPDLVDRDRVREYFYEQYCPEDAASIELRKQQTCSNEEEQIEERYS